ncbi:MAG TPA: GNAT family N-acetyltransferase [Blastocatellia bacterium]|nr:GNAT family N-acetyltransferase [Blastocatellia bacterium]
MATAALSNPEVNLVPLVDADLISLENLFDEECAEWLDLLRWDYKGSSMLIRDVVRQRQLSGFVATIGDATVGFAYYLVEGWRCSIGDIYVGRNWRGAGIDGALATAVFDELNRRGRLRRIESQYVGIDTGAADTLFQSHGFERLERNYMLLELEQDSQNKRNGPASDSSGPSIRSWRDTDFPQAARVIHRSYRGTHDSRINSQYRTEDGCGELLTILTDHIWCGDFLPQVSRVALRASGTIAGVLIASRVSKGVGHIGQISVHPAHQDRGIGRRLIESALSEYQRLGFKSITLAVTSANAQALHLYESCGFRTIHTFPVFYREKK